jgi:hypothetical protein
VQQARRLGLQVAYPPWPLDADFPGVRLLVDDLDLLRWAGLEDRYVGVTPAGLLGADSDLLPSSPPRRVVLYFTGTPDPAERCLTAEIRLDGDRVVLAGLRESLVNTGDSDQIEVDRQTVDSWPLGLPDIEFDREQYLAEVHQAIDRREWESDDWQTAGLLEDYLRNCRLHEVSDWFPDYAQPAGRHGSDFHISLSDPDDRNAVVVAVTTMPGTPDQRARAMASQLLATPASQWPVIRTMQRRQTT